MTDVNKGDGAWFYVDFSFSTIHATELEVIKETAKQLKVKDGISTGYKSTIAKSDPNLFMTYRDANSHAMEKLQFKEDSLEKQLEKIREMKDELTKD